MRCCRRVYGGLTVANQTLTLVARQDVHFRGTSTVDMRAFAPNLPNHKALVAARYILAVTGGVSGQFSVEIGGHLGTATYSLAGITAVVAAGTYLIAPVGYSGNGARANGTFGGLASTVSHTQLIDAVPGTFAVFQSTPATAGVSAHCSVFMVSVTR